MKKQIFYSISFIILLSEIFASGILIKYSMHSHINIRFSHNRNINSQYYKVKYDGVGYLLNKYVEEKIDLGLLEDKKIEVKFVIPYFNEYTELSRGENGYYMAFDYHPTFLEFIRYIDYFSSKHWKPMCKTKLHSKINYPKYAQNILKERINKYTEL
jgi:hypothetical protein